MKAELENSWAGADETYGRHGQTVVARHFGRPTFDVAPPRSRLVNNNFRAPGMSKTMILLTLLPIAPLSDPFLVYFDLPNVGRPKGYLLIKFSRNRLVSKNFRAPGV
jgi:hypothetical protein